MNTGSKLWHYLLSIEHPWDIKGGKCELWVYDNGDFAFDFVYPYKVLI